ncbi:glycine cleavage system aminomethyltransferase GcvT [Carboxydochorda subterranea]|uniref:Aminomethyltransferase n=1 Tax=Carboxydichorda subterranea TaxID=3109565 RepID=A0ABZ1BWP6_9FIRM|nr:glycine cleavage system aminomethyltransferase GcvT [Limnochorda sp. L945t]WRP17099.1 glycine cleavage system aminomethyltransferase GcvT [Limnochorda sp. L945t]
MPEASPAGRQLTRTPLSGLHERLGARMIEFAGWWMPVQYSGIVEEHRAVRERAGIFDLSHMGELVVEGPGAAAALDALVTCNLATLEVGQARYGVMCLPGGGIIDDLVVYREAPERFMLVVNAACHAKDLAWIEQHLAGTSVTVRDQTQELALIAVQGPQAQALLSPLVEGADLDALGFYRFTGATVAGIPATVSRTGYTGEDGFELFVEAGKAVALWEAIMQEAGPAGAVPVGLGARDTLRLEARYPLYGQDIDETTTPLEAGLGWVVDFPKGNFVGRHALLQQKERGVLRRLVGFVLEDRGVPRHGYALVEPQGGAPIGQVTSGTLSPVLQQGIGLGYVPVDRAAPGTALAVAIRDRLHRARIVKGSFVPVRTRGRSQKSAP